MAIQVQQGWNGCACKKATIAKRTIQEHYETIIKGRVREGKREAPQGDRTPQGGEPAAKKSESLSRGKRVPKQKDDNEVGAAVCKEIHIDGLFYN